MKIGHIPGRVHPNCRTALRLAFDSMSNYPIASPNIPIFKRGGAAVVISD